MNQTSNDMQAAVEAALRNIFAPDTSDEDPLDAFTDGPPGSDGTFIWLSQTQEGRPWATAEDALGGKLSQKLAETDTITGRLVEVSNYTRQNLNQSYGPSLRLLVVIEAGGKQFPLDAAYESATSRGLLPRLAACDVSKPVSIQVESGDNQTVLCSVFNDGDLVRADYAPRDNKQALDNLYNQIRQALGQEPETPTLNMPQNQGNGQQQYNQNQQYNQGGDGYNQPAQQAAQPPQAPQQQSAPQQPPQAPQNTQQNAPQQAPTPSRPPTAPQQA